MADLLLVRHLGSIRTAVCAGYVCRSCGTGGIAAYKLLVTLICTNPQNDVEGVWFCHRTVPLFTKLYITTAEESQGLKL